MPDSVSDPLASLAVTLAGRRSDALLGWDGGCAIDHAAFLARLGAWHALLAAQPGRQFALYLSDSIEFAAALLGAWQAGKTVWLPGDTLPASCAALAAAVDGFLGQFPPACAPLLASADGVPLAAPVLLDSELAALVVFTSGSTGAAQAIAKKLRQLGSEVTALESLFGARAQGAAVLATVSHQHIYGLLFKVLWPLCAGRPMHGCSIAYPEKLAEVMAEGPCLLVASPAHLKRLPAHLDWAAARSQLRAVFSSGGPLARDDALAVAGLLGQAPLEVYGSSETGGIAWRQRRPADGDGDEAWHAFPNLTWRVAADDARLEVRSPHLPDAGWLTLADRATAAGGAGFLLLGRSDRIVKIEEKRISLDAIEQALCASGLASAARVLLCPALPGERQKLAAFLVLAAPGRRILAQQGKLALSLCLRAALEGSVELVALPRRWRYLDQLPVDAQGKTTQAQLLALLEKPAVAPAPDHAGTSASVTLAAPAAPTRPHLRLLAREPLRVLFELTVPADLLYFDGHFPGAPILPGVVQTDWAIAYGRQYFDLPPQFRALHALKFQHVIQADRPVQLELLHDVAKGSLNFRYFSPVGQHASGRILFGQASAGSAA